jgi:lipoprotein-anchoring transpeptidase ErfK/SrfK
MAKKVVKPKKKQPNTAFRISILVFGSLLLFIALAIITVAKVNTPFCANSISCIKNLSGQKEATNKGEFNGKIVKAPEINDDLAKADVNKNVLGTATPDNKHIFVDLTSQRLYAYEGNTKVYDFPVSTGKWHPTPTGDFRIWIWLRYTRMTGGNAALGTYYNLPNVPYTMYFSNSQVPASSGYSIHGAYWHNNFGHPMSHGCVNMKPEDAAKIFYWTDPSGVPHPAGTGTLVTIYGAPPAAETSFID